VPTARADLERLGFAGFSGCPFETILRRYDLADPGCGGPPASFTRPTWRMSRTTLPEAPGFDLILRALSIAHDNDTVLP